MKLKILTLISLSLVLFASLTFAAVVPSNEAGIPIFAGATRDKNAEAQNGEEYVGTRNVTYEVRSVSLKIYTTGAAPENVYQFYQQKLGGQPNVNLDEGLAKLKPGMTTQMWAETEYYTEDDFQDQKEYNTLIYPGKWVKTSLAGSRKTHSNGKWLRSADFVWLKREPNQDISQFTVRIEDQSFDFEKRTYKVRSQIMVEIVVYKSEEAADDELDDQIDQQTAAKAKQLASKPPTAKELGAPIYPGSSFDPEISAGMSLNDGEAYYIFRSNDAVATVANFYQQKLGKKPQIYGGSYLFALKGELPFPDEGIMVEPNKLGGPGKTLITFRKYTAN